ncbi:proline-rich protein 3 isoform X4 [Perognathus longimembris pacificus]|uniref:proline-rich protein 3 isoform X4 n=1 Tax=Perognathus longimembris pacificus TaxID=214514 RepID=UPI0020184B0C|nr:proline-rich protein 3 isoform X4 [Perognathus longimembris pacificus]
MARPIAAATMPKRKKQNPPPPQQPPQQPPLNEREETGDEEDESPIGPPSLLGPPPMANGKPGEPKSDKSSRPVCRHFSKKGHCRYEDLCAFYHPGVNGPPL